METVARTLAAFACRLRYEELPRPVIDAALARLTDTLGVALAAVGEAFVEPVLAMVRDWGGRAEATVVGYGDRLPVPAAALVNGTLAHGLDFDDTHLASVTHGSSCIVPTALAVGEAVGASGRDVLAAVVAGWEMISRLGMVAPARYQARGFHTTSVCGTFASIAGAGRLMGLDEDSLTHALGLGGSVTSGVLEYVHQGSWAKRIHAGWAAHGGVIAAQLAGRGFTGPETVFEGPLGFFRAFAGEGAYDAAAAIRHLGREWQILRVATKLYPCCQILQAVLDAAQAVRRQGVISADEIRRVECRIPRAALEGMGELGPEKYAPTSAYSAQFSLPYAVAVGLMRPSVGLAEFSTTGIRDPEILQVAALVEWAEGFDADYPRQRPAEIRVWLRDGAERRAFVPIDRGSPDHPLSAAGAGAKFIACAERTLGPTGTRRLQAALAEFEQSDDIGALLSLTVAHGDRSRLGRPRPGLTTGSGRQPDGARAGGPSRLRGEKAAGDSHG